MIQDGTERGILAYLRHPEHYDPTRGPLDLYVAGITRRKICSLVGRRPRVTLVGIDCADAVTSSEGRPDGGHEAVVAWRCLLRCVARTARERALLHALRLGLRDDVRLARRLWRQDVSPAEARRLVKNATDVLRRRWNRLRQGRLAHRCGRSRNTSHAVSPRPGGAGNRE